MGLHEECIPLNTSSTASISYTTSTFTFSWSGVSVELEKNSFHCHLPFQKSVTVNQQTKPQPNRLLYDLEGIARPGQILAVMGASGVGKTTLMNVLSGHQNRALLTTGEIYLNGYLTTPTQRMTSGHIGYVEQNEIFIDTITLEEHLIFQAMLRMRTSLTDTQRHASVKNIVAQLNLNKSMSTIIGNLSGGEKKRLALASVLLTGPRVLFIDEPTSGLDTYLAKSIMSIIRSIAVKQNHAVIVVLHQPTNSMFDIIDSLCLLVQGGRQAFFGSKEEAYRFFTSKCHLSATSLDGFIEQLAAPSTNDNQADVAQEIAANEYTKSEEAQLLHILIENHVKSNEKNNMILVDESQCASFGRQLRWLLWRLIVADSHDTIGLIFITVRFLIPAFFLGFLYFDLHRSYTFFKNVDSVTFNTITTIINASAIIVASAMPTYMHVCIKETGRGTYGVLAYYFATNLYELLIFIVMPSLFGTVTFWMPNMSHSWLHYLAFIFVLLLVSNTACALGQFISSFSSTIESAVGTIIPVLQILMLFSGFFFSLTHVPPILHIFQDLSPFYYAYSTLITLQWAPYDRNGTALCYQILEHNTKFFNSNTTSSTMNCCAHPTTNHGNLDISYRYIYNNIIKLSLLCIIWHILAFAIIWYRAHKNRLKDYWLHGRENTK